MGSFYIEFPNDEPASIDLEELPSDCFLMCDATFAYANSVIDCPIGVYSFEDEDHSYLEELDAALENLICQFHKKIISKEDINTLSLGVRYLVLSISDEAVLSGDELTRDSDVDLARYKEYLREIISSSTTYIAETHGEDDGAGPGATSAYLLFWDSSPAEAMKNLRARVLADIKTIKSLSKNKPEA